METKTIKTVIPEGYEIDRENSTFENIVLKPVEKKRWRDDERQRLNGYYITNESGVAEFILSINPYILFGRKYTPFNIPSNYNVFATEKQAKSALAMARISQIMANDERFGGVITDEEWRNKDTSKFILIRAFDKIEKACYNWTYNFLAFHTEEQRDLFLEENEDLVKDYLMID